MTAPAAPENGMADARAAVTTNSFLMETSSFD
jgi:hypothetical protein